MGKDPNLVDWNTCATKADFYPFCREYVNRCSLAMNWAATGFLRDPASPVQAIEWMNQSKLAYPTALHDAIKLMGGDPRDWQAAYEAIAARMEQIRTEYVQTLDRHAVAIEEKDFELDGYANWVEEARTHFEAQAERIAELEGEGGRLSERCKALALTVERKSKDDEPSRRTDEKILYVVAIKKFQFKPDDRNSAAKNIADLCIEAGLPVSERTVRDRLHAISEKHRSGEWK
jgi:hypothetical protein